LFIQIISILFAKESVQVTVPQYKTRHDNQAGRLRLQPPLAKTYKTENNYRGIIYRD